MFEKRSTKVLSNNSERNCHIFAESSEKFFAEDAFDLEPRVFVDQANRFEGSPDRDLYMENKNTELNWIRDCGIHT